MIELYQHNQFIYELILLRAELQALGCYADVMSDYRTFYKHSDFDSGDVILQRAAYCQNYYGEETLFSKLQKYNVSNSVHQYLLHGIYPYKGKFHPQLARALINIIGVHKGDIILDPFVGSGTTLLEAQLMDIDAVGFDISPLCVLISNVKTQSITKVDEILEVADYYIHRDGLFEKPQPEMSQIAKDFYEAVRMLSLSDQHRRGRDYKESFTANLGDMLTALSQYKEAVKTHSLKLGNVRCELGDARSLPIGDNTIDGIVTSPPYSIALDYIKNDLHALSAMDCDVSEVKENCIGVRGVGKQKPALYEEDMKLVYQEMFRVLKKGKKCAIVVGNAKVDGEELSTHQNVIDFCTSIGFTLLENIEKIIYGMYNNMHKEYILVFQKPFDK